MYGPILSKSKFTDTEYAIIFALSIWKIGMPTLYPDSDYVTSDPNHCLPVHIVEMGEIIRTRLFNALREYYQQEMHLSDYSVRLGNLITFEHTMHLRYCSLRFTN